MGYNERILEIQEQLKTKTLGEIQIAYPDRMKMNYDGVALRGKKKKYPKTLRKFRKKVRKDKAKIDELFAKLQKIADAQTPKPAAARTR